MKPGADILQELQELNSTLAGMERVNVFTVPEGYFETISTIILLNSKQVIQADVPEGYFDQLAGSILNKIKAQETVAPTNAAEELRQLSPMLYSIQGDNVYKVPAGYFNGLADQLLEATQPAKVIRIGTKRSFFRYAAAAAVAGLITLSVFKVATKPDGKDTPIAAVTLDPSIQKGRAMSDTDFNAALNKLSADQIAGYLENNGNEADIAELSGSIDDNSLPKQDDYILDKQALEKYLSDDITKQTSN